METKSKLIAYNLRIEEVLAASVPPRRGKNEGNNMPNVLQICVSVPRKNASFKAHRLLAHNANVLLQPVRI